MNCAAKNCNETSVSPVFGCFGPCGRVFHAKCIGTTNSFLDKINASKIGCWYCVDCKKISVSFLAVKMSNFKLDILKLSKGFEELLKIFNTSVSNLDAYSSPIMSEEKFTSTEDLLPQQSVDINPFSCPNIIDPPPVPSGSNKNFKRNRDESILLRASPCPPAKRTLRSNSNKEIEIVSVPSESNEVVSADQNRVVVDLNVSIPAPEPLPLVVNVPMEAVPKPKSIFISRLRPELSSKDVLHYLTTKNIIPSTSSIQCRKISKTDSFVSSFKIFAPPSLFEAILNLEAWPDGTLVKEFSFRNTKNNKNTINLVPNSKN